ncbi:UDP-N-acetylmuramate dehydrogenase [Candidatus Saccharibacteria bacterium]|nr:UDP-N-acetylmuramate dehydrogenase [Candidatus Saccharibacteria bacterium]
MKIRENVPISTLTTMRLGGNADFVIDIESEDEAGEVFEFVKEKGLPFYFLGLGANTLGRDEGFTGAILRNRIKGINILEEAENTLIVEAAGGEIWDDFVKFITNKGFSGVEAMSLVPGTVAAAPVQNIGAYGQEAKDTLESVYVYDSLLDEYKEIAAKDCDFAYRHSIFNSGETKGRYFILSATFKFTEKQLKQPFYNSLQAYLDEHNIKDYSPKSIRSAVSEIRKQKLPDPETEASAGSFFKNIILDQPLKNQAIPFRETKDGKYKVNTGWLLENAGLKGKTFHGFKVSDKAALILINESAKSSKDLEQAVAEIKQAVKDKYDLDLEPEPVVIAEREL